MVRFFMLALLCALPAGCGTAPVKPPDTAQLAPGQLGVAGDPDTTAVTLAQWAYADAARTYGRPVEAARAAAAMDYIAGELSTSARWANLPALTQEQLLRGRQEVREALFVTPGTPSQTVVDQLTMAADALARSDQQSALRALGQPAFSVPPEQVLARLNDMPYLRMANVSTARAANELFEPAETE